ncbi:NAD-dependent epimerase/dehydratase family protein [Kitasatospora purpeofusca]|uniref:NAD-dependent epimerase/dehydratase family protein n=1 Tax=Kitasatospora purpeofusca TaxID=67352 RepID=UPI003F4A9970
MRRVVLTGGAGFIGSHVLDTLVRRGAEVVVVDDLSSGRRANIESHLVSERCRFVEMDVAHTGFRDLVADTRPDAVIHLAAQSTVVGSVADPHIDARTNILGTLNVALAVIGAKVPKLVCAASGGTLYDDYRTPAESGSTPLAGEPPSPYGLSKRVAVEYLALLERLYGLSWTALALGNAFGPRQRPDTGAGVVSIFAEALLGGLPVTVFGDGSSTRDYVYVADVADAFVHAVDHGQGLYNIGSGVSRSVLDVLKAVAEAVGLDDPPVLRAPARPSEVEQVLLDSAAFTALGWRPVFSFEDGVRAVADFEADRRSRAHAV